MLGVQLAESSGSQYHLGALWANPGNSEQHVMIGTVHIDWEEVGVSKGIG